MNNINRINDITRPVSVRLEDWGEVERRLTHEELSAQSGRCMECGTPFCHGIGCPLGNVIPEINAAVKKDQWQLAWKILSSTSCFPEFTSRVCPAPCENACTRNIDCESVMIRQLEKAVVETAFERGYAEIAKRAESTGKKVAVIGSGPAGLAMAQLLNSLGHSATVFEKNDKAGGLMRYGIPDFKMDKDIIDRRLELMKLSGVKFRCGTEIGKDVSAAYLRRTFDAVVVAVGTTLARDLNVPGRTFKNIHFALDYLSSQNRAVSGECKNTGISAEGKDVVIIGGGDTGSDCVGTALRQKAKSVVQMDIMPEPPEKRSYSTPWPDWPYQLKTSSSHNEGGTRLWSSMIKSFTGVNGAVSGVETTSLEWEISAEGKPLRFRETEGSAKTVKADLVLLAMGFAGVSPTGPAEELELEITGRGVLPGAPERGIFACGDARTGQSLVVKAIADSRLIASKVHDYLIRGA